MLKKIAIAVLVLIGAVLLYAATKPNTFRVERTAIIKAPVAKVFAQINDLHRWSAWSPWEKMDPAMKQVHSGAASGKGAVSEWSGNRKVGQGRMEITESVAPTSITFRLDFIKPFKAMHMSEFTLKEQGNSTQVTWANYGSMTYLCKLMSVFVSMDKMIGGNFEAGLANLKTVVEK